MSVLHCNSQTSQQQKLSSNDEETLPECSNKADENSDEMSESLGKMERLSVDSTARRQQNAYVAQRIQFLLDNIDDKVSSPVI